MLWYGSRLCIPNVIDLKKELLKEAYNLTLTTQSRNIKMYHNFKAYFWWVGMKRDMSDFVARYLSYQRVKPKHQKPRGLVQPLPIPI